MLKEKTEIVTTQMNYWLISRYDTNLTNFAINKQPK